MKSLLILPLLLILLLSGCATSSSYQASAQQRSSRGTVLMPSGTKAEGYEEYIPELATALRRHGFTPVSSGESRYTVSLYIGGGFGVKSQIVLYDHGVPVITAKASNPGFGAWLIRGVVLRSLFNSSLERFEQELEQLPATP